MRDGLIIRRVHDRHKVVAAQHRVLGDDLAAKLRDLFVHRIESLGILVESLTAFRSQGTEQDVGRHYFYLLSSDSVARAELPARPALNQVLRKLSRKRPHPGPICISRPGPGPAFRWYRRRRGSASRKG